MTNQSLYHIIFAIDSFRKYLGIVDELPSKRKALQVIPLVLRLCMVIKILLLRCVLCIYNVLLFYSLVHNDSLKRSLIFWWC